MHEDTPDISPKTRRTIFSWLGIFFVCAFVLYAVFFFSSAPSTFPSQKPFSVPQGSTLTDISHSLKRESFIRSAFIFRMLVIVQNKEDALRAGKYLYPTALSVFGVADGFMDGTALLPAHKVTIPEGSTLADIDALIAKALLTIEPGDIVTAAEQKEGVLFPDTYLLEEFMTPRDIVTLLKKTLDERLAVFNEEISQSSLSREEIIILASIIEREAKGEESMRIVSGILQKRLLIGMPLQVDATFNYLYGKTSAELTQEDLQSDTPFNTYLYKGLPPSPIASPGLTSIKSVLYPTKTDYLYYLTGNNGIFYYARTFDEHKANKARYLR